MTSPKAIFRCEKLKSLVSIKRSENHTARLQDTPNADLSKKNYRLIGETGVCLSELVQDKIKSNTKYKPRRDAVLCSELFLSASPEFFRPDNSSQAGEWEEEKMRAFAEAATKWLKEKFEDKCVRAELHLDESTPHIHAYVVPINNKTKQLSHKEMFWGDGKGGKIKMSGWQDSYAAALEELGIERGVKGSKAKHTKVKEYYAAVNAEPLTNVLNQIHPLMGETALEFHERLMKMPEIESINHQIADRKRILDELSSSYATIEEYKRRIDKRDKEIIKLMKRGSYKNEEIRDFILALPTHRTREKTKDLVRVAEQEFRQENQSLSL